MERLETQTCNGDSTSFEKEMLALLDEQIFLTDSVFARLPMGVEIYDALIWIFRRKQRGRGSLVEST